MSVFAELETSLQALLALKAPGVTKSRIASITTLCVENVKSEATLVQRIYTHFRRTPATHKLGVLYVVDAVTRQWIDKAGQSSQEIASSNPQDGTFAAGVHKITQLLPNMMNDLISNAPYDQKDKISKLVDIWERGNIFPSSITADFKTKLDARKPNDGEQVTEPKAQAAQISAPAQIVPQHTSQHPQSGSDLLSRLTANNGPPHHQASNGGPSGYAAQGMTAPAPVPAAAAVPPPTTQQGPPAITPDQANQLSSVIPPHIANDPVALQQHLQLLQQLVQLGVPPEQWKTVIDAMQGQGGAQAAPPANAPQPQATSQQQSQQAPPIRNRSRSPTRRRDSPVYGNYGNNDSYRQRSPARGHTPSIQPDMIPLGEPKWTTMDPSLPPGNIKVLSRTLFVGGTTCGEAELRQIFSVYGQVQTCIPNPDKRHAFVKYTNRAGSETAREALSTINDPSLQAMIRSVRWGVGFGPRDCNDYTTGVSIIPIDRLTDADRKWVLTAPHGGSGGKPIESGLVMEEPDIEIGAGVSSKAISRRVGGQDTFRRGGRGGDDRFGRRDGGGGRDRNSYGARRSSPNRQQPGMMPPQGYGQGAPPMPMPMPGYGMPPAFYGMPPDQNGMYYG